MDQSPGRVGVGRMGSSGKPEGGATQEPGAGVAAGAVLAPRMASGAGSQGTRQDPEFDTEEPRPTALPGSGVRQRGRGRSHLVWKLSGDSDGRTLRSHFSDLHKHSFQWLLL